jgi:uncharacterized protein with FMN-binding domain
MSKFGLLLLATTLAIFGAAVMVGYPPWGAVTGISILLTAAAMATGAIATGSPSQTATELKVSRQRVPSSLVALSATAIIGVYAAGYYRTRSAADQFEAQEARHTMAAPAVADLAIRKPALPSLEALPSTPHVAAPPRENEVVRPAAATPKAPEAPATSQPPTTSTPTLPPAVNVSAPPAEPAAPIAVKSQTSYKDGTFLGWGRCRHGSIQASVAIQGGQIVATDIAQCLTRYSCSWISNLPGQVITRQSADVDYVSGATESTDAFYDAVSSALAAARE